HVDNAITYTDEGGRVQVGSRDEGRIVHVWIKDNGIGIPLENLGKIFDRFYIVAKDDLAHQVDRIGLSLPIAKGIIEAHGGRLWVESQVGKGSVFHIDLPKEQPK
ncbi:MAG: sensor histidine kinase, partial [Thermoplasmata archaeon]